MQAKINKLANRLFPQDKNNNVYLMQGQPCMRHPTILNVLSIANFTFPIIADSPKLPL